MLNQSLSMGGSPGLVHVFDCVYLKKSFLFSSLSAFYSVHDARDATTHVTCHLY